MEQVPAATMVADVPLIEHTAVVVEARLTGSPELAVATIGTGATPTATLLNGAKVMT